MTGGRRIKNLVCRAYTRLYGHFHPIEKKILFSSFGGQQYSDNPRAISEAVHRRYPEYRLVWQLRDAGDAYGLRPDYVQLVPEGRFSFYRELATSFCYVTNECVTANFFKREGQFFVNTWHGDRGFKRVVYEEFPDEAEAFDVDGRLTDLCVAGSDYGEQTFRTAFRYGGEVLKVGTPRDDRLVHPAGEDVLAVRSRFPQLRGKKILLYAPTFRDDLPVTEKQRPGVELNRILSILNGQGDAWVCMVRAHSASAGIAGISGGGIVDVSAYPDMADLLLICDMLITDYSSSAGDFVLRDRPTILAVFDHDAYCKSCRSLKFDLDDSPFLAARTQQELEAIVRTHSAGDYAANCAAVRDFYHVRESGEASDAVADRIHGFYRENYEADRC